MISEIRRFQEIFTLIVLHVLKGELLYCTCTEMRNTLILLLNIYELTVLNHALSHLQTIDTMYLFQTYVLQVKECIVKLM